MSGTCYVCGGTVWTTRSGSLRDSPSVGVVECAECGLVVSAQPPQVVIDYVAGTMHGETQLDVTAARADGATDTLRRVAKIQPMLNSEDTVLEVGCGSGGFLHELKRGGVSVFGIELDQAATSFLTSEGFHVWSDISQMSEAQRQDITVVTMFHVLEHLRDPRALLQELVVSLPNLRLFFIEIPCSEDLLLTLYGSEAFSHFTYWSHHEHLHSKRSLEMLLASIFDVLEVSRLQRYGLGNHLGWLAHGEPGGQVELSWLEGSLADLGYRSRLVDQGFSDTLWAEARQSHSVELRIRSEP